MQSPKINQYSPFNNIPAFYCFIIEELIFGAMWIQAGIYFGNTFGSDMLLNHIQESRQQSKEL